ncbi:MAG: amidohydrolase family protein [Planctomycetes bacterium]|nr:amidohydrolase family protein [Planctomycetota bacterium]
MKTSLLKFRYILSLVFIAVIFFLPLPADAQNLIIRGGYFFDAVGDEVQKNEVMVIKSGRFFSFGELSEGLDPLAFEIVTLTDNDYILPGLFDMHAHYRVTFNRKKWDETEVNPVLFLANGVTSTWPAGEINSENMMKLRQQINRGEKIGPRLFNTGPYFGTSDPKWNRNYSVQDIYNIVDQLAEQGVGGLKAKGITREHLQALIDRGHLHGLTVSAHLGSGRGTTVNPKDAILMGLDRVEHFLGGDAMLPSRSAYASLQSMDPDHPAVDEIIQLYVDHNVFFTATLTAYGYYGDRAEGYDYWVDERKFLTPFARELTKDTRQRNDQFDKIYKVKRQTIKKAYDAGVLIVSGTDHPSVGEYIAGFSSHREIDAFVLAGIPAADAIKFATINGAKSLNVSDKLGSIEIGKLADMFITRGNPLHNIRNTRNVHTVIKGGVVFDTQKLFKSVEGKYGPANAADLR